MFQKGKFYTLPIVDIRHEDANSYFIVRANDREYAIRMFGFQSQDPEIQKLTELPCMVKDMHGDNIVFVQNFAEMFGNQYDPTSTYSFIVSRAVSTLPDGQKYYDVHDLRGVPFRLKTPGNVYFQPHQKIACRVLRPSKNKLVLEYVGERKKRHNSCISPRKFLEDSAVKGLEARLIRTLFMKSPIFEEARDYVERGDDEWVIKALLAPPGVEKWNGMSYHIRARILDAYRQLCLYVLEDSDFLQVFSENERENFQEWIADKLQNIETYQESLTLIREKRDREEIDNILRKIRNSGYIYKPKRKMSLLITIFSMKPELLEERIDTILDIIGESAKDWKLPSFNKAFSGFMQYYIMSNREIMNRVAFVDDNHTTHLLNRMVRAICYLLLMSTDQEMDTPLFKSMLYHYLSFVKTSSLFGRRHNGNNLSETLLEKSFNVLMSSETNRHEISWDKDFGQTELFAYQVMQFSRPTNTFSTRSFESDKVRFTVSNEGITIARAKSTGNERNIFPEGFMNWHNFQLYMDNHTKFPISRQSKLKTWRNWWSKVEQALFEDRIVPQHRVIRKHNPDVGTTVKIRVLSQDPDNPNRFHCKIEDDLYQGEGWIDSYVKGGNQGMFHFNPMFTLDSFYLDEKPLLFKAVVRQISNPNSEHPVYIFDALKGIDLHIQENVSFGLESDCFIIFHDASKGIMLGVTEFGYSVFIPDHTEGLNYGLNDSVRVRLVDYSRVHAMQAEVIDAATDHVFVHDATSQLLQGYAEDVVYEESDDELAEEAMSVSEDQFDPSYINQIISILDHKAVVEEDNIEAYGYLSVAHILAEMIGDTPAMRYLDQRRKLLCLLEDFGTNGLVDEAELERLSTQNDDIVEKFPVLKQRICEMRIVNSFGKNENNDYLWDLTKTYDSGHVVGKLARLMLSYNMANGFGLQEHQKSIRDKIKELLHINIELPVIYSFGQESQTTEFKSSIVFPPNNNMQPNLQLQTFNIMKVICGMVNSYGGTLYLGVYDTGTAKGLDDDMPYFDNMQDHFDLYVRNQIRASLGDAVNASIAVEHPDAGKHWIYAIKVAPSKIPVMLRLDNKYYHRQGSSTYPIELGTLQEIMADRNFELFQVDTNTLITEKEHAELEETSQRNNTREIKENRNVKSIDEEADAKIATSHTRTNITDNWVDGYGVDTCGYFRIQSVGEWTRLEDVEWDEGLITLAIHDDERDGYMVIVYEDGEVLKIPMAQIFKKTPGGRHKMLADKCPVFVSPARPDDAVLTAYVDDRGKQFARLDDLANIPDGKINQHGDRLTDVEFERVYTCDIVHASDLEPLRRMHNLKRSSLGFQASNVYGNEEKGHLGKLGIKI